MDILDSKFKVSLAQHPTQKQSQSQQYTTSNAHQDDDEEQDPLQEYYELQKQKLLDRLNKDIFGEGEEQD